MTKKELTLTVLCLLFFVSLFLSFATSTTVWMVGAIAAFSLYYNSFTEKRQLLRERKYIWWMLAFAICLIISTYLLSANHRDAGRAFEKRLPLIILPFTLGLISISRQVRNRILLGFAVIVCLGTLVSLSYAVYQYIQLHNPAWLYNDAVTFLVEQQSIYTSLMVNFSIYIFGYFIVYSNPSTRTKWLYSLAIVYLFIVSYLLASRNMMLLLYLSILVFSFYFILKKRKYVQGLTLLGGIVIIAAVIFLFFPKTVNRFKELNYTSFNYNSEAAESHYAGNLTADQWNGANFRLAAWPCGWQLFKEHPIMGVGLGDKKDSLYAVYRQKDFQFALKTEKNVHNNYLDILFSLGLVGFIIFVTGWLLLPLVRIVRSRDILAFLMVITFATAFLTENYFDRTHGVLLFSFFIPFLLTASGHSTRAPKNQ